VYYFLRCKVSLLTEFLQGLQVHGPMQAFNSLNSVDAVLRSRTETSVGQTEGHWCHINYVNFSSSR
jgi:hypothetical protein